MRDLVHTFASRELASRRRREVCLLAGHAVRLDARCIGWLPWQFYDRHDEDGRLVAVSRNGDLVGFVAWDPGGLDFAARIMQIWVRPDARMIEHGRALLSRVERDALAMGCPRVRLWCAEDLQANAFWAAMDFTAEARRLGRGSIVAPCRGRPLREHVHWSRSMSWAQPTPNKCLTTDLP